MSKPAGKQKHSKQRRENEGRPAFYKTAKELQDKIDEYFKGGYRTRTVITKDGNEIEVPVITITGLVLFLGFCDRQSFYDYEKQEKFTHTIKRSRTFIECEYEGLLQKGLGAGAIFALKNFGWVDKTLVDYGGQSDNPLVIQDYDNLSTKEKLRILNERISRGKTK